MTLKRHSFYTQNKIRTVAAISVTDIDTAQNKFKLIDRNLVEKFIATGATETITITVSATISRLAIIASNLASFTVKYNTSSDFSTAIAISGSTHDNYYFEFNSQAITNIVIAITATQGSVPIKIGQVWIGTELFEFALTTGTVDGDGVSAKARDKQYFLELSNGTQKKISIQENTEYDLNLAVSTADLANFRSLKSTSRREAVVFIENPATQSDEWDGRWGHYLLSNDFSVGDRYVNGIYSNPALVTGSLIPAGGL